MAKIEPDKVWTLNEVLPKISQFKAFLAERGAEVLETIDEYEMVRFRTKKDVSVIRIGKKDVLLFTGESSKAWLAYKTGASWRAMAPAKRTAARDYDTIRARDGDNCFYCHRPVFKEEASEEHLVSISHGGPNHISNKFLAHKVCNEEAGTLSAPEKIEIHTRVAIIRYLENQLMKVKNGTS